MPFVIKRRYISVIRIVPFAIKKLYGTCATRNRRIAVLVIALLSILATSFQYLLSRHCRKVYLVPTTCVAKNCKLQTSLPYSLLAPHLLLILIHSETSSRNVRDVIRETWVSQLDEKVVQYKFVLGVADTPQGLMEKVLQESEKHDDLMLMSEVTNSKASLSKRTLNSFALVLKQEFQFTYILKCDDDAVVDVPRLATELQHRERTDRLYWGYFSGAKFLMPAGPYAESKWFICDRYTPIAVGGGYVLSRDLVELLSIDKDLKTWYVAEDATVSAMLSPYNIERKHDARFNTPGWPSRGCKDPFLITHKITIEEISILYKSLREDGRLCSKRNRYHMFMGYLYDWTVLPNKCCKINHSLP